MPAIDYSQSGYRAYQRPFATNVGTQAFSLLYDKDWTFQNGTNDVTGGWRPFFPSDFAANISLSGASLTVGAVAVTGGQITINNTAPVPVSGVVVVTDFSTLTGQVAQLQQSISALTGTVTSKWQKAKTAGYATVYSPITGGCLVNKVQGYSKTSTVPSFIQIFDSAALPATGSVPDFVVATQPNNFFLDLAEAGVQFNNGLTIVNSSDAAVYVPYGTPDFIANVVYKL